MNTSNVTMSHGLTSSRLKPLGKKDAAGSAGPAPAPSKEELFVSDVVDHVGSSLFSQVSEMTRQDPSATFKLENRDKESMSFKVQESSVERLKDGTILYHKESSFLGTGWFGSSQTVAQSPNGTLTILE